MKNISHILIAKLHSAMTASSDRFKFEKIKNLPVGVQPCKSYINIWLRSNGKPYSIPSIQSPYHAWPPYNTPHSVNGHKTKGRSTSLSPQLHTIITLISVWEQNTSLQVFSLSHTNNKHVGGEPSKWGIYSGLQNQDRHDQTEMRVSVASQKEHTSSRIKNK